MNIQIDTVRISGFRGICNIEVTLPRVTVLLGQNNAGKTSIVKALQLGNASLSLSNAYPAIVVGSGRALG